MKKVRISIFIAMLAFAVPSTSQTFQQKAYSDSARFLKRFAIHKIHFEGSVDLTLLPLFSRYLYGRGFSATVIYPVSKRLEFGIHHNSEFFSDFVWGDEDRQEDGRVSSVLATMSLSKRNKNGDYGHLKRTKFVFGSGIYFINEGIFKDRNGYIYEPEKNYARPGLSLAVKFYTKSYLWGVGTNFIFSTKTRFADTTRSTSAYLQFVAGIRI